MKLIIVTPPTNIDDEIMSVKKMLEQGLQRLHLRKEAAAVDVYRNYLRQIPSVFHSRISIHDYPELQNEFPTIGFHCKTATWKDDKKINQVLSHAPATLSASFHSWEEVLQTPYAFKYVFISPVFESISKPNYTSAIDITKLLELKQHLSNKKNIPDVYALGGVTQDTIQQLRHCGFDGVAVLGSVWQSADSLSAFQALTDHLGKLA